MRAFDTLEQGRKESPDDTAMILLPIVTYVMSKEIKKRNKFTYLK
jgi:hypothetical protein